MALCKEPPAAAAHGCHIFCDGFQLLFMNKYRINPLDLHLLASITTERCRTHKPRRRRRQTLESAAIRVRGGQQLLQEQLQDQELKRQQQRQQLKVQRLGASRDATSVVSGRLKAGPHVTNFSGVTRPRVSTAKTSNIRGIVGGEVRPTGGPMLDAMWGP